MVELFGSGLQISDAVPHTFPSGQLDECETDKLIPQAEGTWLSPCMVLALQALKNMSWNEG